MPKIPRISGREAVRAFEKIGYRIVRQKGSHMRMINPSKPERKPITIPDHRELGIGLLRRLLRDSNLTVDRFIELLK